jgi:uncharacterized OB-fold protein
MMPQPDRDSAPYWAALANGTLQLQHCLDCGRWTWPPRPICSGCHGERLEWKPVKGTGEVYSWVVVHRAITPALSALVPYTTALIRIDEQNDILIPGRLISDADAHRGMRVRAALERVTDDVGDLMWVAI